MRTYQYLTFLLAFALCLHAVAAAPQYERRQDDSSKTPTPTAGESSPSLTITNPTSTRVSRSSSSEEAAVSSTTVSTIKSVSETSATSTSIVPSTSALSPTAANLQNALPIQPKITPALGLAGIILLVSGAVYAVIGIRSKWVYVFGSAVYLSSLAVTVLIVYLMSPQVSNAIQGAFFVAVFLTGIILGALALVFADITDGLGCLLGGFCLSMWFLALKDGGLIDSMGGRAIFIGCMCAAGYALSWSHYTRNYGLIFCISFAGATITILGIDCFSRAGLKEFWLYLWNLNPDIFPLYTDTYPMTRGVKAELAGVIILTVFGVISQLQVWKIVKEHRTTTSAQRLARARDRDLEEEERGRKIEDKFQKERAQWKATYDKKSMDQSTESGITTPLSPESIREQGSLLSSSLEIPPLLKEGRAQYEGKQASVMATVQEDEIQQVDALGEPLSQQLQPIHQGSILMSGMGSARPSSEAVVLGRLSRSISQTSSLRPSAPPPPVLIPLPFRVPQEDDIQSQASDNASISAVPDIPEETRTDKRSFSRHHSDLRVLSANRPSPDRFDSLEPLDIPHIGDDRASSVVATLDDDTSTRELSPPISPLREKFDEDGELTTQTVDDAAAVEKVDSTDITKVSGPRPSLIVSTNLKPDDSRSMHSFKKSPRLLTDSAVSTTKRDGAKSQQSRAAQLNSATSNSKAEQYDSATGSFVEALPTRFSRVAQAFRVNEWSKHLEAAEKPDEEEIKEPESPGVQLDHERSAPVGEEIAQPILARRNSNRVTIGMYQNTFTPYHSDTSRTSQNEPRSLASPPSVLVAGGVPRSSPSGINRRATSSLSQSPAPAKVVTKRFSSAPGPPPHNALMGQRESLIPNRSSPQSFLLQSTSSNNLLPGDDMTLAQRKRALQHQKPPPVSQKWQKNKRVSVNPSQAPGPGFDSHQPKRASNLASDRNREVLLAGWRESIRQNSTPVQTVVGDEQQRRAKLMNAKRQREMGKQQCDNVAQQRESKMHDMMRSSGMLDAHREAMRRMQGIANKNSE